MSIKDRSGDKSSLNNRKERPLFISFDINANGLQFRDSASYLRFFGENVGNLAFVYAMSTQIKGYKEYFGNTKKSIERIKSENDLLVFPAANNINQKGDMGWLANLIEGTNLPIVIVGLGVQASFESRRFDLPAGTRRFLDIIRDRQVKIGVRGAFTQEFLHDLGVDTAVITGCPSNFINPSETLGVSLEEKFGHLADGVKSIALNLEYFSLNQKQVNVVTGWLSGCDGALVLQSDEHVFSLVRGDLNCDENKIKWMGKYFIGDTNVDNFISWLHRYGRIFCHTPSWMDFLRGVNLSVGSRFHGNMLALQSGTPAIVFPHDSRTLEMCKTMNVPHFPWEKLKEGIKISDVIRESPFSGRIYDQRRSELAREYRDIILNSGLDLVDHVKRLC